MKLIRVGAGFEDPWIDEGSGGSGDDVDDVIFQPATKTSVHTTTSSHPPDVTTVVSSVIRYVTTTVTQEQDAHTVKMSGFIDQRGRIRKVTERKKSDIATLAGESEDTIN
ncbi:hypothetical protein V1264_012111 [Littorina saxatilis]|uniref:Uncharacterized protein n=1 Tax=Littorina saxatilis TaxID=31220 RepID=A0AAN9GL25_9CAEN